MYPYQYLEAKSQGLSESLIAAAIRSGLPDTWATLSNTTRVPVFSISAFPQGITVEGATPRKGEGKGVVLPVTLYPSRWRTSGQKGGVAPSTITPLVRRAGAPGEEGTRGAQPRSAFSHGTREFRVIPCPMRRFGKVPNDNGEGSAL